MSRIELSQLDAYDEDAPFLDIDERHDEPISAAQPTLPAIPVRSQRWNARTKGSIVLVIALVKFGIVFLGTMMLMPMFRLIEDIFCHAHYQDDSPDLIDEMKCKVDEVQSSLATIGGIMALIGAVVNLLVAYPYGMLADRIGRKPVLLMSFGGLAVSFLLAPFMLLSSWRQTIRDNPYIMATGPIFTLFGGGVPVLLATLYSVASDASTDETKASSFLYLGLGAAVGGLGGPLVSGVLMNSFGPWVPIFIVVSLTPFLFVLIMLIPETLAIDVKQQNGYGRQQQSISQQVSRGLRDMKESLKILKNTNVALLLVTFFFSNARFSAASSTLAQYISKHFGWTLAETSILLSPLGLITITMLALLPRLSDILISPRVGLSTFKKDLYLTRTALCIQFVAAIIQGLSRGIAPFIVGLVIGSFGGVESPLARATISHFVEPMYTSRLHAVIGMAETLGAIVGGPVLAICFTKGLELKGFWTGLPWFYIAVVSTVCLSAMAFVRQPRLRYGEDESEADGYRAPDNPIHLD